MIKFTPVMAAAVAALGLMATPASAQLLGGILGGGDDGVGGIVESVTGDTGLGDTVGGLLGGSGGAVDLNPNDDGNVGVENVLTVGLNTNDGTSANGTVLGGGGDGVSLPLDSVLGGNSGVSVDLPGLGGGLPDIPVIGGLPDLPVIGGDLPDLPDINIGGGGDGSAGLPGRPGAPGVAGLPGVPGINGNGGNGGGNGINGNNGSIRVFVGNGGTRNGNGGAFQFNSSRLKMLARILQNRAWLRFAEGNKICLPSFGVANVASWVKPNEYQGLQQLIAAYSSDIATLQQMMKRCRNGQNRMVDASRVIGVDLKDGQIVVMTM